MNEQEAYAKGLEKLGFPSDGVESCGPWCHYHDCNIPQDKHKPFWRDLRKHPAFAWRVQNELQRRFSTIGYAFFDAGRSVECIVGYSHLEGMGDTQADALYAAVCQLGREDSDGA